MCHPVSLSLSGVFSLEVGSKVRRNMSMACFKLDTALVAFVSSHRRGKKLLQRIQSSLQSKQGCPHHAPDSPNRARRSSEGYGWATDPRRMRLASWTTTSSPSTQTRETRWAFFIFKYCRFTITVLLHLYLCHPLTLSCVADHNVS